ncbi:HupE/UreJ family protein [Streptomyces sp. NPDC002896]|uniref:HupE/UreJ family protein n=1 Tax=Streptomyces sp. NPDC002896 TaxID=3154438 RepID=UPI003319F81D
MRSVPLLSRRLPSRRLPAAVLAAAAILCGLLTAGLVHPAPAAAHDANTTAYAEVTDTDTGTGTDAEVVLDLEYDLLMKSAWLYAEAYDAKGRSEQIRQLRINADAVTEYVTERLAIAYDDKPCTPSMAGDADVHTRGERSFAVLKLTYACPGGAGDTHEISSALFPDAETFVHSTETIVDYDLDGQRGSAVLTTAAPTLKTAEHQESRQVGEFFLLGAEHLLFGLDHILFLLSLLMGARGLRDVVLTATAFTAAHSVTFLLAAMGVVDVPGEIVEPVIAASIVVVALANLRYRDRERTARWRLPVVFVFGLIHGLGFAGALGIDESWSWELLLSLLSFNAGIEAVQLGLIALLFPPLVLLRRSPAHRWALPAMTAPVVAVSLYWFCARIPLPV